MPTELSDKLLRKTAYADEEAWARAFMKMIAAGVRYPDGKPPHLGVKMLREWLREHCDEDSFDFHLLNLVEVDSDDAGWSLDGIHQGEPWTLIEWIVGEMSSEQADRIEHALENYDSDFGALVIEAHERRIGKKLSEPRARLPENPLR